MPGAIVEERPPAGRQPFVHDHQRDDQHDRGDRDAQEVEHEPQRLQQRHVANRGGEDQRRQHHQERQHQQADRGDQHVADRFQPQQPPASALGHAVGAVQADAQALDAARGEVDRERDADGEQVAAGAEQHAGGFRLRSATPPRSATSAAGCSPTSSASCVEPNRKPASAVTRIRNGNSDISADSAIWLAIAQPSSARNL